MAQTNARGNGRPHMAKGALPHYADGGFIGKLKGMASSAKEAVMGPEETMIQKFARQDAERAAKNPVQAPVIEAAQPKAISDYVGNSALQRREKAAGLKIGGAIRGPGTGTSDDVPIMASNGEFMIKAAAVKKIGLPVLEALNEIADGEMAKHENGESKKVEAQEDRDEQAGRPERDGMKAGGAVRKMATGGLVTEEDKPRFSIPPAQTGASTISTTGAQVSMPAAQSGQLKNQTNAYIAGAQAANPVQATTPQATPQPEPQGEYARQMGAMGASAMRGVGNMVDGALWLGKTAVSAPGYGFSKDKPIAMQATLPVAPSSTGPMIQASYSNEGRVPTPVPAAPRGALPTQPVAPAAPSNQFGDGASWNSNRAPMSAQDQGAMNGIQARQDARDSAGLQKLQYDQEVAAAQATNKWNADRFKSPRQLALEAQTSQGIRTAETERYKADQGVNQTRLTTDANRYGTDAQRESAKGQLGVAQGRLAMDQESQGYDNRAKGALEKLQVELDAAQTDEQRAAIVQKMQMRQGKGALPQDKFSFAPGGQITDPATGQLVTQPGVIFNERTGQPAAGAARPSLATDPRAIAIRDNKTMTRDQKLAELKKMGYQ